MYTFTVGLRCYYYYIIIIIFNFGTSFDLVPALVGKRPSGIQPGYKGKVKMQ